MSVVIKAENISKQYRLGEVGTGSLKDDFKRWRYSMMGKEDPFLTVGDVNDRTTKTKADYVWALKDINFEVKQGEVLGVVGKNGAGKSTLLKILSRTTGPTTGSLKMKGRIASLLEVGTGFHAELSGRENIFLNGAIMGMSKAEIRKKFDEIVDFAGVEKYIDTPVKRYSSGMYVRLAFGVAAHLEPEILIVDEVLAVGDAEFQKKAISKLQNVSKGEGRTVLFVSHSMTSVQALCTSGIYLEKGSTAGIESIAGAVDKYLYGENVIETHAEYDGSSATYHSDMKNHVKVNKVIVQDENEVVGNRYKTTEPIFIKIYWENLKGTVCSPNIQLRTAGGINVMVATDSPVDWDGSKKKDKGEYCSSFKIPAHLLNANDYFLSIALDSHSPRLCYESHIDVIKLSVWDPMDETSLARGMFTSVREDMVLWPALECSYQKLL